MSDRLKDLARRFGPTMATTLVSQGVSAVALVSIVLLGAHLSDAYALAIQVGTSAFSGVVLQVLYYLAIGRPWMRSWALWSWLTAGFSVLFAAGMIIVTTLTGGMTTENAVIVALFGIGGAFLGLAGVVGVRRACLGDPIMMVGVTIVPNVALAAGALIVRLTTPSAEVTAFAPAAAWAITSVAVWIWCLRVPLPPAPEFVVPDERDTRRTQVVHATTLSIGLAAGTIYPALFIAALSGLPTGTTTVLFLVSRIGTSLVGLLVNSILAVRFNWHTETASTWRVAASFAGAAVVVGGAGVAVHAAGGSDGISYGLVAVSWSLAIIAAPLVLREMHARRQVLATSIKTFADLALVGTLGTWFLLHPSVSGFFGIYVALQGVALLAGGFSLRRPLLTVVASALLLVGVAQVLLAW